MLAAAIEMLAGGVVLLAVAAATGEFSRVQWSAVPATVLDRAGLPDRAGLDPRLHRLRVRAVAPVDATVSTYAYVNPVVAVLAGILFLGEQFSWREGLGAALVLASVDHHREPAAAAHGAATRHCAECSKWWYGTIK